jgi:hypothetical protein
MIELNNETRELTLNELDTVNGGFLAAFLAGYVAGKVLDGELSGQGFVAQASNAAKAHIN